MPDAGEIKARVVIEYDPSGVEAAKKDLASLADISGGLEESAGGASDGLAALDEQMGKNSASAKSFTSAIAELPKMVEDSAPAFSGMTDALSEQQGALDAIQDPLKSYNENIQALSDTVSSGHLAENMSAFHNALDDPFPFQMLNSHLSESGQSWNDFTSSIGAENTAFLEGMGNTGMSAEGLLGGMSESFQSAGKSVAGSIDWEKVGPPTNFMTGMEDAGKAAEETGSAIAAAGETAKAGGDWWKGEAGSLFGEGGLMGILGDVAMPLMTLQMVGAAVGAVGQSMYDAAAIAEGPAAHSIGSFTGAVDVLNATVHKSGQTFSESFGQGALPALNGINNVNQTNANNGTDTSGIDIGKGLGMELGLATDTGLLIGGAIIGGAARTLTLNPDNQFGQGMVNQGLEGFQNYWADWTGQQEPYPTLAPQPSIMPDQQIIDSYYGVSNSARDQAMYGVSHYGGTRGASDPMNAILQYELDNANGGSVGMTNPDPNAAWAASFAPSYASGGCFPAGTKVLLANGDEKPIETLQIGDQVQSHDGTKQVQATITDCITFAAKQTYRLVFSDGNTLLTTDSHPIASLQGWKSIDPASTAVENPGLPVTTLEVGDMIYTVDGSFCRLLSLQKHEITTVYNITVDTFHTYYANNVLVHNAKLGAMSNSGEGSENVSLSHTFTATVNWAATGLEKQFTAAAQWAEQNLTHTAVAAAQWAEQNLVHTAVAAAQWAEQNLTHSATAAAQWAEENLIHPAIAAAQWAEQGLVHEAIATATWAEQGLEHLFTGKASWIGEDLNHMFTAVAQWTAQNLNPSFTVNPSVTMLAEGASNFAGGPAIVAEAGYPEVVEHNGQYSLFQGATLLDLPAGANVYPMKNLSSSSVAQFADGTDGPTIPLTFGASGGSMPQSVSIVVQLDSQSILSAIGMPMAQNMRLSSGFRGF